MGSAPFGRVLTAMATPFDTHGGVDVAQAKRLAVALVDSGTEGLVVTGTTGESPTLTRDEKMNLYAAVLEAVGDRATVIAGTTTYNTAESVELSREADRLGVHGVLLTVPYYNKPPQEGLFRHFSTIADAVSVPCVLYNVPTRTGLNMTSDTTLRLSRVPNIVGVKEASADYPQIERIIQGADADFFVWSGNDADTLSILKMGGYGVVSVVAHLVGRQVQEMVQSFRSGATEAADEIHARLLPLVDALFIESNPIPLKHMLRTVGFNVGDPRLPLVPPSAPSAALIDAIMKRHRIDLPVTIQA
ncbi:MAG: 4-hydroxy-tetrahydrodipicolinate synthase [Chloroflexi bacterium]|nr:4-hydroxy-tetrahydrodipicolinate synthase [Chloroflexota bacterium]